VVAEQPTTQIDLGDTEIGKRSGFSLFNGSWLGGKNGLLKGINDWMKDGEDFHE
jgi:hypothetical protein